MKKFFLIPLMTLVCSVMAWADNIAQITIGEAEPVGYETLSDLQAAIAALPTDGTVATIKLLDNINAGNVTSAVIQINLNQIVTLDLNGHNIKGKITSSAGRIIFNNNGKLTIDDTSAGEPGTIENTSTAHNDWWRTIYSRTQSGLASCDELHLKRCKVVSQSGVPVTVWGYKLTIEDGVELYANQPYKPTGGSGVANSPALCICSEDEIVTINGGKFISVGQAAVCIQESVTPVINISGGEFSGHHYVGCFNGYGSTAKVNITGGTFDQDVSEMLDQTVYFARPSEDQYVVTPLSEYASLSVGTFAELKTALDNATLSSPVTVTLVGDVIVNDYVKLKHGSVLNIPAGRTLSVVEGGIFVNDGVTVNNGSINITGAGFFSKPASVRGTAVLTGAQWEMDANGVINYAINTPMDLQWISYLVQQKDNNNVPYAYHPWNTTLNTDITFPDGVDFEPIEMFQGEFNGNDHYISNIKLKGKSDGIGIFYFFNGYFHNVKISADMETVNGSCAILTSVLNKNSTIEKVTINGSARATGQTFGLAAFAANINGTGTYTFVDCVNNATINASEAGLILGGFLGTITTSTSTFGFYNCVNNGNISSYEYVGSLIGYGSNNATINIINYANNGTLNSTINKVGVTKKVGDYELGQIIGIYAGTINCAYADPAVYTAVYDENEDEYVAVEAGTLDNKNSTTVEWEKSTTWTESDDSTPVVPNASDSVTVNNTTGVVINNEVNAEAKVLTVNTSLTVNDGGTLTIGDSLNIKAGATVTVKEGATLVVGEKGITIADGGKLVIETGDGNTLGGTTAVVLVSPDAEGEAATPEAEITFIPDAYKEGENAYQYRYFGIPLDLGGNAFSESNWTRELVDPADAGDVSTIVKLWDATGDQWQDWTSISQLQTFKGYAITNNSYHGVKYTFKGKLMGNGNGTMQFANGYNLFANSYTAPINIQTLLNGLSDNVKATIYMFVGKKLKSVSKLDFSGFRTPAFTVIPSMQGFFVLMDDGTSASETVNYAEAVYNNTLNPQPLYAPARNDMPDFNRVRINIAAENGENDALYLIETADYTSEFENGYDEAKFMNDGLNLFATTAYGRQSTEITNDLNGTFIGVQGNGTYTMSFDELVGEEYQIRDLQTNAVVTMSEANTYTFTANGTNDTRFVVESIAKMPTAVDNVSEAKMFINNNTLYISENNSNANIMIYAANGQLVLNEVAQPTVSLNGLASGVYTVRVANQTLKFVK